MAKCVIVSLKIIFQTNCAQPSFNFSLALNILSNYFCVKSSNYFFHLMFIDPVSPIVANFYSCYRENCDFKGFITDQPLINMTPELEMLRVPLIVRLFLFKNVYFNSIDQPNYILALCKPRKSKY